MSALASPAGSAAGPQAEAYTAAILEALGDRDPLEVLRETPTVNDIVHLRQIDRIRQAVGA